MEKAARIGAFVWKFFVGAVLCQFALTSILAIGWAYRAAQRYTFKRWWLMSGAANAGVNFREYARGNPEFEERTAWPNWLLGPRVRSDIGQHAGTLRRLFGGLKQNAVIGVLGVVNTWTLTLLPVLLWNFGWYAGWLNSFHKGYEQHYYGIALSFIGIGLFIAVMFYLPIAQTRQAVSGDWRSFYQFKLIWAVVRRSPLGCFALAAAYAFVSLPVSIMKIFPQAMPQAVVGFDSMTDAELLQFLNRYYFWMGVVGFGGYVLLRLFAARVYAVGLLRALRERAVPVDALSDAERRVLDRLHLTDQQARERWPKAIQLVRNATRPAWRVSLATVTAFVWFAFVAQIYVSQFLIYHPVRGWLNQPLVQLPWFRYVPDHLQDSVRSAPDDGERIALQ